MLLQTCPFIFLIFEGLSNLQWPFKIHVLTVKPGMSVDIRPALDSNSTSFTVHLMSSVRNCFNTPNIIAIGAYTNYFWVGKFLTNSECRSSYSPKLDGRALNCYCTTFFSCGFFSVQELVSTRIFNKWTFILRPLNKENNYILDWSNN